MFYMQPNFNQDIEKMIHIKKDHSYSESSGWDGVLVSTVKEILNEMMVQLDQMRDSDRIFVASNPNQLSGPVLEIPLFGYINYKNIKPFTPREDFPF